MSVFQKPVSDSTKLATYARGKWKVGETREETRKMEEGVQVMSRERKNIMAVYEYDSVDLLLLLADSEGLRVPAGREDPI